MDGDQVMKTIMLKIIARKYFLMCLALSLLSGCASKKMYYWGEYQTLIYNQYQKPEKAAPEYQIEQLEKDIQIAKGKNLPLPPGFYAHLGYQYLQTGKAAQAKLNFEREKSLYPESAVLMNRFLKKL